MNWRKKYNYKAKQTFTGINESWEPDLQSPADHGGPESNPLHGKGELRSALQES